MAPAASTLDLDTTKVTNVSTDLFDVSTLFVADKAAAKEAAEKLVSISKNEGVEFFGSIGLPDAMVKVSSPELRGCVVVIQLMLILSYSIDRPSPTRNLLPPEKPPVTSSPPYANSPASTSSKFTSSPPSTEPSSPPSSNSLPTKSPPSSPPLTPPPNHSFNL